MAIIVEQGILMNVRSGQGMSQRTVMMQTAANTDLPNAFSVMAPRDASVMPPGHYLLFVTNNGVPSEGVWIELGV